MHMVVEVICTVIAIYSALRVIFERNTLKKLIFLNVMSFAVAGAIVMLLPHPITIVAAVAYFVGATLESNAVASVIAKRGGAEND